MALARFTIITRADRPQSPELRWPIIITEPRDWAVCPSAGLGGGAMVGTHRPLAAPGTCTAQSGPGPGPRHMHGVQRGAVSSVIIGDDCDQIEYSDECDDTQHLLAGILSFHKIYLILYQHPN